MLKMVRCDKFMENGSVRPPIMFKRLSRFIQSNSFSSLMVSRIITPAPQVIIP